MQKLPSLIQFLDQNRKLYQKLRIFAQKQLNSSDCKGNFAQARFAATCARDFSPPPSLVTPIILSRREIGSLARKIAKVAVSLSLAVYSRTNLVVHIRFRTVALKKKAAPILHI